MGTRLSPSRAAGPSEPRWQQTLYSVFWAVLAGIAAALLIVSLGGG